tara:strand:- start:79 stop:270 length:192 start_codon:yes stop_codon:yes gene_type:complete
MYEMFKEIEGGISKEVNPDAVIGDIGRVFAITLQKGDPEWVTRVVNLFDEAVSEGPRVASGRK